MSSLPAYLLDIQREIEKYGRDYGLDFWETSFEVLDYKTGERDPHHAAQVKGYLQSLKDAGFETTEGWLLYLREMELVVVA